MSIKAGMIRINRMAQDSKCMESPAGNGAFAVYVPGKILKSGIHRELM